MTDHLDPSDGLFWLAAFFAPSVLFGLWTIVAPGIVWRVRKLHADRRWLAEYRWARAQDFELPALWADFQTGRVAAVEHGQRLVTYRVGAFARDEIRRAR